MTRCLLIFFILSTVSPNLSGQVTTAESEFLLLQKQPAGIAKVNQLNSYAEKIQFSSPEAAIEAMNLSIATAQKINYPLGLSVAYGLRAGLLFYEMKLDTCLLLLNKAFLLVKDNKDPGFKNQAANLINKFAAIDQRKQNFDLAIERYLQAAGIFKETGEHMKIIITYYNLAGIYKFLGDTSKMLFYARETNKIALKYKDTVSLIRGLIAMGDAYSVLKQFDSAYSISIQGLLMAEKQDLTFAIGIFNNFIGLYYTNKLNNYDTAIAHYLLALKSFNKINTQYDIALVYQNMGNAYLQKRDYVHAVQYSSMAVEIAERLHLEQVLYFSLRDLVKAEDERGNYIESYRHLKRFVSVSDSLQNKNNQKKVYQLESRYQEQQKEMQLLAKEKVIDRKNLLNYLLGIGVCSLMIIFVLLYRNHKSEQVLQQQRITDLETEKKLMAAEAVLKGEEQERTRLAQDLHDGLGGMLSGLKYSFNNMKGQLIMTPENSRAFEQSMDMVDDSIREMRRVAHNMMPEALVKFGLNTALKEFCHHLNQTGALQLSYQSFGLDETFTDQTTSIAVYRIVQELVNNTLKHSGASACLVQVGLLQQILSVTVEDDGSGFNPSLADGMGWKNIRSRVELLKGNLDLQSEKNKGTSVHIEINLS